MRGALLRPQLWLAGTLLALAPMGGCDLNPQPLPPEQGFGGEPAQSPTTGSGGSSSSGASSGSNPGGLGTGSGSGSNAGGMATGSSSGSASSGSGGGTGSGGASTSNPDAGAAVGEDAAVADAEATIDGAADAAVPIDSGSTEPPADAAPDGEFTADAGCVFPLECYATHPGLCSACRWPQSYAVCVEGQCACACEERDAAEDR
jgi:hypothetical protein